MEELLIKLHTLSEEQQSKVLFDWIEGIDKGTIGAGMTDAAKGDIGVHDYDDLHLYARKNGGAEQSVSQIVQWVKEEDEDEYKELLLELNGILSK